MDLWNTVCHCEQSSDHLHKDLERTHLSVHCKLCHDMLIVYMISPDTDKRVTG